MTDQDDLASAYLPDGVTVDETTRHVAAQLALAWLQLTPLQRRLVLAYERTLSPREAALEAGYSATTAATDGEHALGAERVRMVLRLRSTLQTETVPPAMIGRVFTRILLGIDEGTPHARIRAGVELARVQGAYIPPSRAEQHVADESPDALDQDAQDRIVQAAMGASGISLADLLRQRAVAAQAEADTAQEALATQAEVESAQREEAARVAPRKKYKPRPARPHPVTGTVPEHLANTDSLAAARAKMGKSGG